MSKPLESVVVATKTALKLRHSLLPYLYTLFFHGWIEGEAIVRHLFYEYNWKFHNKDLLDVDDQFFWGSAVMFIPPMNSSDSVDAYFPYDTFYSIQLGRVSNINISLDIQQFCISSES